MTTMVCEECGKTFKGRRSSPRRRRSRYCSQPCAWKHNRFPSRAGRAKDPAERFAKFVSPEPTSGCFLWTGSGKDAGYGAFFDGTRQVQAHRYALAVASGKPIPAAMHVCHKCDNPGCVNPAHLFVGTRSDNVRDCAAKGRMGAQRRPETVRGERNPRARLTADQVKAIRARYAAGGISQDALALEYGVAHGTVGWIVTGQTWREGR